MSSAQRRAREKENLRRAILDAARELFVTESYEAVSMRRIASKIEYSPTAIYLYFKDKDEIFRHLVEEGFTLLSERLEALHEPDPLERLRQGGRVYLDFAFTQPHYYRIMFEVRAEQTGTVEPEPDTPPTAWRAFGFIRRCVAEAMTQSRFREETEELVVSHAIWAAIHGAASLTLAGRMTKLPGEWRSDFYETVIEMTVRGFLHR